MELKLFLLPVFLQIALTLFLLMKLAFLRVKAITSGKVAVKDISLGQKNWPVEMLKFDNCFHNQLETPFLFYFLSAFILILNEANLFFIIGSWLFVLFRFLHAFEETTKNNIARRFKYFMVASIVLILMWSYFLVLFLLK